SKCALVIPPRLPYLWISPRIICLYKPSFRRVTPLVFLIVAADCHINFWFVNLCVSLRVKYSIVEPKDGLPFLTTLPPCLYASCTNTISFPWNSDVILSTNCLDCASAPLKDLEEAKPVIYDSTAVIDPNRNSHSIVSKLSSKLNPTNLVPLSPSTVPLTTV